jgi:hypothetical protein
MSFNTISLAVGYAALFAILAGRWARSNAVLLLGLIKKIDWTAAPPQISLTRWAAKVCLLPVLRRESARLRQSDAIGCFLQGSSMKLIGFLLLLTGWFLVLTALEMLRAATPRALFILAGLAIEVLGLVLVFRAHLAPSEDLA